MRRRDFTIGLALALALIDCANSSQAAPAFCPPNPSCGLVSIWLIAVVPRHPEVAGR
jgi:hypothetical protein